MRRGFAAIFLALIIALGATPIATAQVVVFEDYTTTATIKSDSIHIQRDVRLKNIGNSPIIPGELHFRLYERRGGQKQALQVNDFSAQTSLGQDLQTRVSDRTGETDLAVQLWDPLLPGFHTDFTIEYELEFNPSGILFYEIRLPEEETTIPISNENTRFMIGEGYHVTYAPGSTVSSLSGNTVVEWDDSESARVVEYSRLPLPRTGFRAVNAFWLMVILALVGAFILSVRRQKTSQGPPPQHPPYGWQQQSQHPPRQGGMG